MGQLAGLDALGGDVHRAVATAARQLAELLEHRGPHVQLDLLVERQAVEQQARQAVAAARPRLDADLQPAGAEVAGAEADPPGLQMTVERHEAEARRLDLDGAHRAVPRARHADGELVAHAQLALVAAQLDEARQRGRRRAVGVAGERADELFGVELGVAHARREAAVHEGADAVLDALQVAGVGGRGQRRRHVVGDRAGLLGAVHRRRAPHVVPAGDQHAGRPAGGGGDAAREREGTGHAVRIPTAWRAAHRGRVTWRMIAKNLHRAGVRSDHLELLSLGSVGLCVTLWIRAKTVDQDERGNAERRALFVGLWPPTIWLIGDSLGRLERRRRWR
jgi:hypothetical protein